VNARRLLVYDSDPALHELAATAFAREGHSIRDAYNRRQALKALRESDCALVVAGIAGNGGEAPKLLRQVRAIRPRAKMILAGARDPAAALEAMRGHAYAYFHSPVSAGPLADMAQLALEAGAWRDDIRVASARPQWVAFDVRCKLDAAERATQFVRELLADIEPQRAEDMAVAFRELLINAIEHGGKSNARKRVQASLLRTARSAMVRIADPGRGFSLKALPHAAISNPDGSPTQHIEYREEHGKRAGGFGILMARNLVDDLIYNERGNAVLAVKYLK
jgi:anti-sigma regulatory factor (Ser/Thr protein kinase)/ActR/RegA family two-component response regulator